MFKKSSMILAFALAAVILLAACERSASNSPQATPTIYNPLLLDTATGMPLVSQYGTQTALAAGGFPTATPEFDLSLTPGEPTATTDSSSGVPPTGFPTDTLQPGITPIVTVATTTPGRPATYTLQIGEYPYCIARRFNLDPQDLLDLNNLDDGEVYQPGLQLKIPQTGTFPGSRTLHTHPSQYTVTAEDTIYRIACYFGDLEPTQIAAANGLTPPYTLTTGTILNIP